MSSLFDFPCDELVELVPGDALGSESSDGVEDLNQLLFGIIIFELLVNVSQVVQMELSFSLDVQ